MPVVSSQTQQPHSRISVALSTYNGEKYLAEQLASIAAQSTLPLEIQVGDDGSSDATEEIVKAFARSALFPVSFHRNATQLGFGENFIQTAGRCSGDWIAFCDQDDVWLPNKIALCQQLIDTGPDDLRLIAHAVQYVDDELIPIAQGKNISAPGAFTRMQLPPEWFCFGMTQIFLASLVKDVPSAHRPSFSWHKDRSAHDVWISLLANATGSIHVLSDKLALYRRHGKAQTFSVEPEAEAATGLRSELFGSPRQGSLDRADYLQTVAALLADCARDSTSVYRKLLTTAVPWVERCAMIHRQRAALYAPVGATDRLKAFLSLCHRGAYVGRYGHLLSRRSLAKDLVRVALGDFVRTGPPLTPEDAGQQ